jgi:hypothetical protein
LASADSAAARAALGNALAVPTAAAVKSKSRRVGHEDIVVMAHLPH